MAAAAAAKEKGFMVPELRREREASRLDLPELTRFMDGGDMFTEKKSRMRQLVREDPVFRQDDRYFHSNEEAFDRAMEKSVRYIKRARELDLDRLDRQLFKFAVDSHDLTMDTTTQQLFASSVQGQGTPEQKEKWLPLATEYKIIGAYAQTELGHGSNVRGLETTATYVPSTQEFVMNTPTLTATKWWPGTLGHTATHAIVLARLLVGGKDLGVHAFIMQVRSLDDHTPLPGVRVGDIGPKFGYFGMDNGFLQLDNVRIPRDQMLMKHAQVTPEGVYVKPPTQKLTYATMVGVRSTIVIFTALGLSKAVTIATRYSVVRRQGQPENGGPETQVLDYQTQQLKLLPLLAQAYGLILTGQYMLRMHLNFNTEISKGNLESLPELHATSAGLKAFSSEICSHGMELCRLACGGHGYSLASGIPFIYVNYSPSMTYEGENTVMYLQTARYLHKLFAAQRPVSALPDNVSYLGADYPGHMTFPLQTAAQFSDAHLLLEAYRQRARRLVSMATDTYKAGLSRGLSHSDSWNGSTIDWTVAARAHCHYVALKAFYSATQSSGLGRENLAILQALCSLFATFGITQNAGEFMLDGYLSTRQLGLAREHLYSLLSVVRREAVPLVDAFDYPDEVLNSALGRYDGDVYTHLYQWALKAPRNKRQVHETYEKHLKPLLKGKL